jgi:hypothetical protein
MCKQRNRRQSGHGRPVGTVPVDVNPMRSKAKRTWMGCCRCTPAWLYVYACFALVLLVLGFRPWPPRDLLLVEARAIGRSRTTHVGDCRRVPVLATGRTGGECVGTQAARTTTCSCSHDTGSLPSFDHRSVSVSSSKSYS